MSCGLMSRKDLTVKVFEERRELGTSILLVLLGLAASVPPVPP